MDLSAYCRPVNTPSGPPPGGDFGGGPPKRPFSGGSGGGGGGYHQNSQADDEQPNQKDLKRRCIDYHTPAVLDLTSRLYRKPNRRMHTLPGGSGSAGYPFLQCHTNYLKLMGLPVGEGVGGDVIPSVAFLTYCAHVTRAKNSNPVM